MTTYSMKNRTSWYQKAKDRAQTLNPTSFTRGRKTTNEKGDDAAGKQTGNTASPKGQSGASVASTVASIEKSLTELSYKPATMKGHVPLNVDTVNVYNLDWWELEEYLKKIYPGVPFPESQAVEDHYLILVPRPLTDVGFQQKVQDRPFSMTDFDVLAVRKSEMKLTRFGHNIEPG
ncbi:hypothetical protein F4808DRAFT_404692 [Astrocystis sublimbata]|nr:hypothetical protein F4808DRAFT_404692 [Astrocystis sublimbata]